MAIGRFVRRSAVTFLTLSVISCSTAAPTSPPRLLSKDEITKLSDAQLYEAYSSLFAEEKLPPFTSQQVSDYAYQLRIEARDRGGERATELMKKSPEQIALEVHKDSDIAFFLLAEAVGQPEDRLDPAPKFKFDAISSEGISRRSPLAELMIHDLKVRDLSHIDDAKLRELYRSVEGRESYYWYLPNGNWDAVMSEVVARGGNDWRKFIAEDFDRYRNDLAKRQERFFDHDIDVNRVTVLRRLQGQPDPIQLVIEGGPERMRDVLAVGNFVVTAENVDADKLTNNFRRDGGYRSGRLERWRFEVRDAAGHIVPDCDWPVSMGGGLFQVKSFAFGDQCRKVLPAASYVRTLPPGHYTVAILYHNYLAIANDDDIRSLICFRSNTVGLTVNPRKLKGGNAARAQVNELLPGCDEREKLKIISGTYGQWAYEFVPPTSAQGKLLAMGLDAVIPLIDALDDSKLSPQRRAQILSLLYGATGQNDPRSEPGLLGPFESQSGPWIIEAGEENSFGIQLSNLEDMRVGIPDVEKQLDFAKRWKQWRNYFVIAD